MQTFKVEWHRASIQLFDSEYFELPPETKNDKVWVGKSYLAIPVSPDHLGSIRLDLYDKLLDSDLSGLKQVYEGDIDIPSGIAKVESGLPSEITQINFDAPGKKHVMIYADKPGFDAKHIAICIAGES